MSAANKAKGTAFESQLADYLQRQGVDAKRLPRTGVKDIGDIAFPMYPELQARRTMVVEAKNRKTMDLPTYLREAGDEADNYEIKYPAAGPTFPMVVVKRRGKGVQNSYVVFDLDEWIVMMRELGVF